MSENPKKQELQENVHSATDPQKCIEMAERYNWKLLGWRLTNHPILKVDCVFEGEQTTFEEDRHD